MERHEKTIRLRVEADAATATLETVLAVVRRGGVVLNTLSMAPGRHGTEIRLCLGADDEASLQLCRTRLCNVIGILKLREIASSCSG